ncbi:MAG: hypothetical protein KF819_27595 [Labilithrix sp.]|nr:hypothetical protein [Labilithrix sp.]
MLTSSQHEVDVRIARYLGRLAGGTAGRKVQFFLETIAWAWAPARLWCFKGVKWRVTPSLDAVTTVARYAATDHSVLVRAASLAAVAQAGDAASAASEAVRLALADPSRRVRLAAARAAAEARLGESLGRELRASLADEIWAVRWYAARALAGRAYDAELGELARMLVATTPRGGMALTSWAHAVEAVRPRCRASGQAADLEEHVRRMLDGLSPSDRDFAWPLTRA